MKIFPLIMLAACLVPPLLISTTASAAPPDNAVDAPLPLLSPIFSDNMVLQRDKPNTFWGWTTPGAAIHLTLAEHTADATATPDGRWQLQINPPPAGGPYSLTITGAQQLQLHNLLVGDVWLCGGQSNMELPLARTRNGDEEIKTADHPEIRLFTVKSHASYAPTPTPEGTWKVCSPATIAHNGGFSAVAYFFGRQLHDQLHVPIGLIQDCVGGTPAETWTSPDALHALHLFEPQMTEMQRLRARGGPEYGNFVMPWYDEFDIGLKGDTWAAPTLDTADWKAVGIPGGFSDLGVTSTPAVAWFRKDFTLPATFPSGKGNLALGVIERMDTCFINGKWIGASAWVENPRNYPVPEGVLHPGTNVLAVRVFKTKPNGGFMSAPSDLHLDLADKTSIPLAGEWVGKISVDARPPHPMPMGFENWPVMPTVLYQGMLKPLAPLAITGAIWYQGEANADRAAQYRTLLPAMIHSWRDLFQQGDFPIYIVSLPAFMPRRDLPGDDAWAELREAQAFTASAIPNAGLAVTIDTGEADNIHPKDKRIVGERLALVALAQHYGQNIPFQGPTFTTADILPDAIKLHFAHTDGGLVSKPEPPKEFSIAGKDHHWHWADAKIDGDTITLSSRAIPHPIAARYAWQSNPAATLYNGAGLPAVPFRTDDWPALTEHHP